MHWLPQQTQLACDGAGIRLLRTPARTSLRPRPQALLILNGTADCLVICCLSAPRDFVQTRHSCLRPSWIYCSLSLGKKNGILLNIHGKIPDKMPCSACSGRCIIPRGPAVTDFDSPRACARMAPHQEWRQGARALQCRFNGMFVVAVPAAV